MWGILEESRKKAKQVGDIMMQDTMLEERSYPCEQMHAEELDKIVEDIFYRNFEQVAPLTAGTYTVREENIPWMHLRHLHIVGNASSDFRDRFRNEGLHSGCYLNSDGSWLLILLHEGDGKLRKLINKCSQELECLSIYNTRLFTIDIGALTSIRKLNFRLNPSLRRIDGFANLTLLTTLDISKCPRLANIYELDKLAQLTSLRISECESITSLPELEWLTELNSLSISGCSNITAIPELQWLTNLKVLSISHCDNLADLRGLEYLTQLNQLYILRCSNITALSGLERLSQLTDLYVFHCAGLSALPGAESLLQLNNLCVFDCSSFTVLPDLENLTNLSTLNIYRCKSLSIPQEYVFPPNVATLDISGLSISYLPNGIRELKKLRRLDLCYLKLKDVPDWLPEIAEEFSMESRGGHFGDNKASVALYRTTVDAINDMSIFDQPYEMVAEWFKNRQANTIRPLNEIKVVFLGDGEAGKSHTIARLMNDGGDPDYAIFNGQSTPGIVIRNKEYDLGDRKIQVHYWDFGGQEIMHSMHRIFLTGRTMYVILLNARDDTQSDRAKYWLHNVKSFAPNAPVLLVLNKIDQNETASVDEKDLRSRYEKLTQVVKLSAMNFSQEQFNDSFTKVLLDEIKNTGFLDVQWPIAWTQVKQRLENMSTHYIMGDAYQTICKGCQVDDNQKNLLHWFNDLGVSFCCCDEGDYTLEDYVILRPDWITNALYIILFNKLEGAKNGLIPHASIYKILKDAHSDPSIRCTLPEAKYNSGDIQYVLGVMRKFNLSFSYGTDYEFIPMLCQQNSTVDIQYYHKDEDILEFNMEFDYLPNNLLHRLMVERHQELDMDNVWRSGARFQLPGTELSSVVTVDDKVLHIFIRNDGDMHRPNTYLAMLKANVDKIVKKMGLKAPNCKLVYKLDGKRDEYDYDDLMLLRDVGQTQALSRSHKRMISIDNILQQSAPAASENLNTLLDGMISAGLRLQGNKNYRGWDENGRNSVVRDSLGDKGYIVLDQNLRGTSETGKSYGELDLLIQRVPNRPWVLCEALIAEGYTHKWNEHLDKLLNEYNPHGLSTLFLLTYVDCEKSKFDSIWTKYKQHIQDDGPKNFIRMPETVSMDLYSEYEYIKIARCSYQRGSYAPIVYHIFVQMDPKP